MIHLELSYKAILLFRFVYLAGGFGVLEPDLEALYRAVELVELFEYLVEVASLEVVHAAVHRDLGEAVLFAFERTDACKQLDRDLGEIFKAGFRNVFFAYGAFVGAVVIAELGVLVAFLHGQDFVRVGEGLAALDLFYALGRDVLQELARGVAAPIVGATKVPHFDAAVRSVDLELSADEIAFLEAPYRPHAIVGALQAKDPKKIMGMP